MKKVIIGTVLLLTTTLSVFSQTKNITVAGRVIEETPKEPASTKPQYSYFRYLTVHLRRVSPLQHRDILPCPK